MLCSHDLLRILKRGGMTMEIKWFGQSCFMLTTGNGTKIVTDPFNASMILSYKLPDVTADIVTTSHNHGDHNNIK